jgi:integrase
MAKQMKGTTCITRNGSAYWYAQVDGRRVYCGKDEKGRKLAEAARSKYVGRRYEHRELSAGLKTKHADFKTVEELSDWYMTQLPFVQEQAVYSEKIIRAKHLLDYLGNRAVGQVEAEDLERYREHRKREGVQDGTIDNEISLLRAMYNEAKKRKKILPEMMPGHFPMNGETNPRPIITEDQYRSLLENAASEDFRDVMVCAWESAMRSSEIASLTAGQVHLNVRHISGETVDYLDLGIFDTKTGARRTVPVSAELKEVLERRTQGLGPDDLVFTEDGKPYHGKSTISNRMKTTCKAAKIPHGDKALNAKGEKIGLVFHCFRHTRVSRWVEAGYSDEIIRRASGHDSLEAYRTYVKLDPSVVMRLVASEKVYTERIKPRETQRIQAC